MCQRRDSHRRTIHFEKYAEERDVSIQWLLTQLDPRSSICPQLPLPRDLAAVYVLRSSQPLDIDLSDAVEARAVVLKRYG
jgi:hypothetical protein